jgi:Transposase IS4
MFYVGKQHGENDPTVDTSVTHNTVMGLLKPLHDRNHIVHMDNYYTSIPLFMDLEKIGIYSTGTVRTNRKGLCKEVTIKKGEETQLKKKPGYCRFASSGNLVYIAWFDKRPVHLLSNCYQPLAEDSFVTHWYPAMANEVGSINGKIQREVYIPPIVKLYNQHMGAVDTFDQYRSYIKLDLRSRKYWHCMFWFIIESALVNAWVLYKETMAKIRPNEKLAFDNFTFRKAVALGLAEEWKQLGCILPHKVASPTKLFSEHTVKKARKSLATLEDPEDEGTRFTDPTKHFGSCVPIPCKQAAKSKYRPLQCVHCNERRTTYWCKLCRAALCIQLYTCYLQYHTCGQKLP